MSNEEKPINFWRTPLVGSILFLLVLFFLLPFVTDFLPAIGWFKPVLKNYVNFWLVCVLISGLFSCSITSAVLYFQSIKPSKIALAIISLSLSLLGILSCWYHGKRTHFDSLQWKFASLEIPTRSLMVEDLLRSYVLKGMSRQELVALLGEPNRTWQSEKEYTYFLGPMNGFDGLTNTELSITIRDEKVFTTETRIYNNTRIDP